MTASTPIILALIASVLFGFALVLTQFGLRSYSPRAGAAISVPSSALMFWVIALWKLDFQDWNVRAAALFIGTGFVLGVVTLLTFESNKRMGPSLTGAFGNVAPLFAVLFAIVLVSAVPDFHQVVGIILTVIGVVILSSDRTWLQKRWPLWLALLPIAAAILRGIVQPLAKEGLEIWDSPLAAAAIGYTGSALVVTLHAFSDRQQKGIEWPRVGVLWFVTVGLANGCATLAMYSALSRGSVELVSPIVASYPIAAVALTGILVSKSQISWQVLAGATVSVFGVGTLIAN
jgi:drug/metabolite transporter (DMT)-like permease